jgi:hypothetical protein
LTEKDSSEFAVDSGVAVSSNIISFYGRLLLERNILLLPSAVAIHQMQ